MQEKEGHSMNILNGDLFLFGGCNDAWSNSVCFNNLEVVDTFISCGDVSGKNSCSGNGKCLAIKGS